MGKLSVSTLVTLDGVIQDPGGFGETSQGGWGNPYFTEEAQQDAYEHLMASDYFLCGRITYELLSKTWGKIKGGPYLDRINSIPKLVASGTLTEPLEWNATLINGRRPRGDRQAEGGGQEHRDVRQRRSHADPDRTRPDRRVPDLGPPNRDRRGEAPVHRRWADHQTAACRYQDPQLRCGRAGLHARQIGAGIPQEQQAHGPGGRWQHWS